MVRGRRWAEPRVWVCVGQRGSAPQLAPARGLVLSSAPGQVWGAGPREGGPGGRGLQAEEVPRAPSGEQRQHRAHGPVHSTSEKTVGWTAGDRDEHTPFEERGLVQMHRWRACSPEVPSTGTSPRPVLLPPTPADPLPGPQCAHPTTLWGFRVPEARGPHPRSVSSGQLCPSGKQVRVPRVPQAEWTQWDILSTWLAPRGLGLPGTAVSRITGPGDGVAEGEAPETSWSLAHCT